jgi:hypothetical protein
VWARVRDQRGQATVEWVGLIMLAGLVLAAALAAAGARLPGAGLARTIASRIVCAVSLSGACSRDPELVEAYGQELAELLRRHAPRIAYEAGMSALPVDFRSCRSTGCADGAGSGVISRSRAGEPVAAFVRVVDCRPGTPQATATGGECSGSRAGRLYLQYWFYYPDSATLRGVPAAGPRGYHRDDWESYQVRIGPDGADARASSHHGYNYELGRENWASDAGIGPLRSATEVVGLRHKGGWGPETGWLYVSGGSHAGNAKRDRPSIIRATRRRDLRLIPVEPLAGDATAFSVTPPWLKTVYRDPEDDGT